MIGRRDHRNHHFMRRNPDERYYGLGEKAGGLERTGRRFEMRNLDAMGYDAQTTDPLYKHIPFTITDKGRLAQSGSTTTRWLPAGSTSATRKTTTTCLSAPSALPMVTLTITSAGHRAFWISSSSITG